MKIRPRTLRTGVECDVLAMKGYIVDALGRLEGEATESHNSGLNEDTVWLRLKRAELLGLNGQKEEALAEFEQHVVALEPVLKIADRAVIGRNRSALGIVLSKPESHRDFYASADLDTSNDSSLSHMRDLLRAERASRERQHYDSLPPLWRELMRCYRDCDLNGRVSAHARMARETLDAAWALQAVHHAVLGHSEKGVEQLAESLIAWRRSDLTHSVTDYLLTNCYLAEHLRIGAVALRQLADVVPDALIPTVFDWVQVSLSRQVRDERLDPWATKVWEAVRALTPRFSSTQVETVIEIALSHSLFRTPGWGRKAIIRTLTACVHNVKDARWADLAEACIPLCTSERWHDYDDALNLIMTIASHSEEAKVLIADNLVPSGSPSRDLRMMVVAHELGRKVDPDGLRRLVAITAERISKQVQHDAETDEPSKLSYHGTSVVRGPKNAVAVEIHSGILELEGVAAWKDELSSDDLSPLTTSMLRVMADRANLATNRVMLMQFLGAFAERLSPESCRQIAEALEPFARGAVPASIHDAQKATTVDRFQMKTTTQEEQQANAVRILFRALSVHSLKPDGRLVNLLADAFAHHDFHVRRAACHAMSQSTDLLVPLALQLLLAIQDPTEEVSGAALLSTASVEEGNATRAFDSDLRVDQEGCCFRLSKTSTVCHVRRTSRPNRCT